MAKPYCEIYASGENPPTIDIAQYIEEISWESNDLDAPKSGRDLAGYMHRGRTAEKRKINIKLVPIKSDELVTIMKHVRKEYIKVTTNMIPTGDDSSFDGYNSTRKGGVMVMTTDGEMRHSGVSFNIIER